MYSLITELLSSVQFVLDMFLSLLLYLSLGLSDPVTYFF
jgi:hypothetical protein